MGEYLPLKQLAAEMDDGFEPFIIILSDVEYMRLPYISPNIFKRFFFSVRKFKKVFYVVCFCLLLFKFETISDENNKKTLLLLLFGGSTDRVKRVKNNVLIKFERSSSDLSRFKVQKVFRPGKYFHSDWAKKKKNNNDDDDDRLQREQVNPGLNPDQI